MTSILSRKFNKYSQNGEDGIIEFIFQTLNIKNGYFVEFGAWDGKHLSNTYKLFEEGWKGIYIEGDKEKAKVLKTSFQDCSQIICLEEYVGFSTNDNLDRLIENTKFKDIQFDFISIDVDGIDYFIFEKIEKYLPRVICIEVSSGHSPIYDKLIPLEYAKNNVGQSIYIMSKLAEKKGYFPLCYTGNLFLVKNEFQHLFKDYVKNEIQIYNEFCENIIGNDKQLRTYLYDLYFINKNLQKRIFNGYVFEDNNYLKTFLQRHNL